MYTPLEEGIGVSGRENCSNVQQISLRLGYYAESAWTVLRAWLKVFSSQLWMTTLPSAIHAKADPLVRLQGRGFRLGPGISGFGPPHRHRVPHPRCANAWHGRVATNVSLATSTTGFPYFRHRAREWQWAKTGDAGGCGGFVPQAFHFSEQVLAKHIWNFLASRHSLRFSLRSAALHLIKVESDINGILPAGGGPLPFISFLSWSGFASRWEGNGILRSTARCARSSRRSVKRKSFWDFVRVCSGGFAFCWAATDQFSI